MPSNDEFEALLAAREAAMKDFRYTFTDALGESSEIEAYQVTPSSRFDNQLWPKWLEMQKSPSQVNRVYCESGSPNDLTLMMKGGVEQPLGTSDWLVYDAATGDITVWAAGDMEGFAKTVPVPDKPVMDEELPGFEERYELDENNNLVPRKDPLKLAPDNSNIVEVIDQEIHETLVSWPPSDQRVEDMAVTALRFLRASNTEEATAALVEGLSSRVQWCHCAPGSCEGLDLLGCRVNSPLVK